MKIQIILLALIAMFTTDIQAQTTKDKGQKILIIYYSLRNGNTRIVAEHIQRNTGGDIFRIETVKPYPVEYNDVTAQAKKEIESGFKPAIKSGVKDIGSYDVIFVGSPNWWSTIAPAVGTFLSTHNLAGKIIIPFITHEGTRMGNSVADIKKLCPESTVLEGLPVRGSSVEEAGKEVQKWLQRIEIIK